MAGKGITPGTWHITPNGQQIWGGSSKIAAISPAGGHSVANARAIAALPELLAALDALLLDCYYAIDASVDCPNYLMAIGALAKARGTSEPITN